MRGDHGEVAQLLINHGGKIFKTAEGRLVDLNRSHLAGSALSSLSDTPQMHPLWVHGGYLRPARCCMMQCCSLHGAARPEPVAHEGDAAMQVCEDLRRGR